MHLSVVIPAFNEAPSLEELHHQLIAVLDRLPGEFELIFVDDGSTDATPRTLASLAARDPRVIPLRLEAHLGKAAAYARGFAVARGELIATLDADLQDDPAALPALMGAIAAGHDFVIGRRRNRARHEPTKTLASTAFNLAASLLVGPRLHDINSGFRVFRRAVLPALDLRPGMHRFLPSQAHQAGFRVIEVPVAHRPRRHGRSKYSYARAFVGLWGLLAMGRTRLRGSAIALFALAATVQYAARLDRIYPIEDWLFWKYATIWGWTLFLGAACVSAGHFVLSKVLRIVNLPTLETVVHSAAIGLTTFVLGMYAGGFAHRFNARFAVAWPTLMLLSGARPLYALVREKIAQPAAEPSGAVGSRAVHAAVIVFGVLGVGFVYLGVMAPEAINFDASWSHLKIAVDYARHGGIVPFDGDYTRNVPELASLVHTFAMIVPEGPLHEPQLRWMLAQHVEFFFFLVTLGGVAAMARWLLDDVRTRGTWAAFFLFPAIFVYDSNLGCAADHYLAVFAAPLFLAAMRAMQRFDARECILAGALAAGAMLTKYQAVYLLAGTGTIVVVAWLFAVGTRLSMTPSAPATSWRQLLLGPAACVVTVAAITAPHFAKNWAFHHNPVYPFAQDVFESRPTLPNAAYLFEWIGLKDYAYRPHGTLLARLLQSARLSFTYSFEPHYSFTKSVPAVGSLFTLCLPLLFWLRPSRRLWLGYAAGMGALFAWAMIYRVDRHLQTFLPLLVASTAAVIARAWSLGPIARVGVAALVGLQVIWGGDALVYDAHSRIAAAFDLVRSGYEGQAASRFRYLAHEVALGRSLPKDARVLLHTYRPSLGIDRDVVLDVAGAQGLLSYEGARGPKSLWQTWRAAGITHLVWLPGHLAAPTKQEDVLFTDFVIRWARERRRFGGEEVVALPAVPPPVDGPYRVLSLGGKPAPVADGYEDGLYAVESMKTYEAVPEHRERYPTPERPWSTNATVWPALLDAANAVVIYDRYRPDSALKRLLDEQFIAGQRYVKRFTIYVRKRPSNESPTSSMP